jgi:hypothetical protein
MRQNIKILGMSTTSEPVLGESYNLVNLREKNGAMVPVSPREKIKTFNFKYDMLFMHQMAQFGIHYIGVRNGNVYFVYDTAPYETLLTSCGSDVQISQIGNVLNITSNQGIKHAIWYENAYVVIDTNFDGEQTSSVVGPCKVDLKVDSVSDDGISRDVIMHYSDENHNGDSLDSVIKENQRKIAEGLMIKSLAEIKESGLTHGFMLACTALELFDGSYILHSQPILIGQALDMYSRYNGEFNYDNNRAVYVDTAFVIEGSGETYLGNFSLTPIDYVDDIDKKMYAGKSDKQYRPIFPYDNNANELNKGVLYPAPNLYAHITGQGTGTTLNKIYSVATGGKLKFKVNSYILNNYKALVKSVSVFVTQEVNAYKTDKCEYIGGWYWGGQTYNWQFKIKTNAEILKELQENQLFYKVHEIPFDELTTTTDWIPIDLKGKLGDNLVNQEQLPVDNFTRHSLIPVKQYIYNSRLHILNYTSVLGRGWPYGYMQSINGVGQFEGILYEKATVSSVSYIKTENGTSVVKRVNYYESFNTPTVVSYPDTRATKVELYIEPYWQMMSVAELQLAMPYVPSIPKDMSYWSNEESTTNTTLARLVNMNDGTASSGAKSNSRYLLRKRTFVLEESTPSKIIGGVGQDGTIVSLVIGAGIVTYTEVEDQDITQGTWTISRNKFSKLKYEYKLKASDNANFSYFINENLKPEFVEGKTYIEIPSESNRNQIFQSGLKVSEVNNPFNFPAKNTYTIGNGRALNLSSNAMRVSEGQFGQYPLYVFTEDGVYALQIGTDVLYITQAPISTEQPISDKILSIPYGICFITKKGLQIINGQQVDFVGAAHEQLRDELILDKISISSLNGAFMANNEELYQYLRSNDLKMAYNPHESEVLLTKGQGKIFCANLTNLQWYISTEKWDNVVENSFPDLYVKLDNQTVSELLDYESAKTENGIEVKTQCVLTTRAFNLGTEDYKRLSRVWIRGQVQAGEKIFAMLHGSIDGRVFKALKGIEFSKKSGALSDSTDFKDFDLGLVTTKHRQYAISLAMTCGKETKINNIEIVVDKEYDNEKL